MQEQDPQYATPLDYADPETDDARRDPMSYYREPPTLSELTVTAVLTALGLLALVVIAGVWWYVRL